MDKEVRIETKQIIAVMGIFKTSFALAFCMYLGRFRGLKVAYIEKAFSSDLKEYITEDTIVKNQAVGFRFHNVDFFTMETYEEMSALFKDYSFVIIDMSQFNFEDDKDRRIIRACSRIIFIESYAFHRLPKTLEQRKKLNEMDILEVEFYGTSVNNDYLNAKYGFEVQALPYIREPLELSEEIISFFDNYMSHQIYVHYKERRGITGFLNKLFRRF